MSAEVARPAPAAPGSVDDPRLAERLAQGPLTAADALGLALGVVEALAPLHAAGRVFGALHPRTVRLGPGARVSLADAHDARHAPDALHYIAPEQTGRLGRAVDGRADHYALGVLLYEATTGRRPLADQDAALDVVHAQLARVPSPPAEVAAVPRALSDVVMRLLAKSPEDRYQSAAGLRADLEACRALLERGAIHEPLLVGLADQPPRWTMPARLYGREAAEATLDAHMADLARAPRPVVLIEGPSGVGKSALVARARSGVEHAGARFVAGKFDQLRTEGPYAALADALRALLLVLLGEAAPRRASLSAQLRAELADELPWLVRVLPEVRALVGAVDEAAHTTPAESQARVARAVARLLARVAEHDAPVVVFIDDLQWADPPTLECLRALLVDERQARVQVLLAQRSDEVSATHPAAELLARVAAQGVPVARLSLGPLAPADTRALVVDTLQGAPRAAELAALVHARTDGNPFFVGQFLSALSARGALGFDARTGTWRWDEAAVERTPSGDGVLSLITARLITLPPATQALLATAALLGHRFEPEALAAADERPRAEVVPLLDAAVQSGFLEVSRGARVQYAFVHDRVQQAASAPLGEQRGPRHATIAERLVQHLPTPLSRAQLHDVAAHAAAGATHLTPSARPRFVALLSEAARQARAAAAFARGAEYGQCALELLGEGEIPGRALELVLLVGECWGAAGELERAFAWSARAWSTARTPLESARAAALEVVLATTASQHERAVDAALRALVPLGYKLRRRPPRAQVAAGLLRTKLRLAGWSDAELLALPRAEDPHAVVVSELLLATMAALFQTGDLDLFALCAFEVVRSTLAHGPTPRAGFGFVCYGMVHIVALADYASAARYGDLGVALSERHTDSAARTRAALVHGMFVHHWTRLREAAGPPLARAFTLGCASGEVAYAGYTFGFWMDGLSVGPSLDDSDRALERGHAFTAATGDRAASGFGDALRQLYRAPRGLAALDASHVMSPALLDALGTSWRYWWHAHLTWVGLLMEHPPWIDEGLEGAARFESGAACSWQQLIHTTAAAVIAAERWPRARGPARRALAGQGRRLRRFLARWAAACPSMGAAYLGLVDGAWAAAREQPDRALVHFEAALARAHEIQHWAVLILTARRARVVAEHAGQPVRAEAYALWGERAARAWGALGLPELRAPHAEAPAPRVVPAEAPRVVPAELAAAPTPDTPRDRAPPPSARPSAGPRSSAGPTTHGRSTAPSAPRPWATGTSLGPLDPLGRPAASAPLGAMSPAPRASALGGVDAEALTRSLQALSRELSLEPLLTNLLDVVVRTAGARRGTLARAVDGLWVVQASAASDGADSIARDPTDAAPTLPQALLHLAASRPTPLVLADARLEPELARDPYLQARGARSLLALPITRHGRGTGVVLLENELVAGAFTRERVAMLELMSAQIAISLENAELYEDLKRNNASLAEALEAARVAARTKGILLANVSHELRTPLNGVIGVVELLRDVPLDPQGRTLLRSLEEAAEHLVRGVGGLIAYTEVESGELRLDVAAFDVARMIARVVDGYGARAEARGLRLRVDTRGLPTTTSVRGDSVRLAQVLRHLLENALTYTERGEVAVRVTAARDAQHLHLTVIVEDQGIGMSPQTLAHAFDGLHQADSTSTKTRGGLGVGLAYARRALTLMGGRIELSSTLGVGTTATLEVPLALGATSLPPELSGAADADDARPRELVLVAEDNVVNQRVLTMMLTRLGMPFRVCRDGAEAVAAYAEEGPRVRCVLMDCQMPNVDGFEATLRIRGTEVARGWARVPVIAVTANALASDRDKCLDAGMDDHLSKPVRLPELGAAIARATGTPDLGAGTGAGAGAGARAGTGAGAGAALGVGAGDGPSPRSAPDAPELSAGVPSGQPLL